MFGHILPIRYYDWDKFGPLFTGFSPSTIQKVDTHKSLNVFIHVRVENQNSENQN